MTDLGGYREIRARLRNPPGGRRSSEIEIVPGHQWARRQSVPKPAPVDECEQIPERPVVTEDLYDELFTRLKDDILALVRDELATTLKPVIDAMVTKAITEPPTPRVIRIAEIIAATAKHYGIPVNDILSARRTTDLCRIRQIGMYLAKTLTLRSTPEIGRRFGGRDHTTVLHGIKVITGLLETDEEIVADVAAIKSRLTTPEAAR